MRITGKVMVFAVCGLLIFFLSPIFGEQKKVLGKVTNLQVVSDIKIIDSPPYKVGQTITAEFSIKNNGAAPITFDILTVGGRVNDICPNGKCPDFEWKKDITLKPNETYHYNGRLTLETPGDYHFFTAYKTKDGWNTAIATAQRIRNTVDIKVVPYSTSKEGSPPIPYEDYGICSGEGCMFGEWVACQNMEIRKGRDKDSPFAFQIAKGERVTALTGVVITTKLGRAIVLKSFKIGKYRAEPGDNIYLLTYRGEGVYNVWFKGKMYNNLGLDPFNLGYLKVVDRPETIDWVQIKNSKGQIGWRRLSPQSYFDYRYGCE